MAVSIPVESTDLDAQDPYAPDAAGRELLPPCMIKITPEQRMRLTTWLDEWINTLSMAHQNKQVEWAEQEKAYRAKSLGPQEDPFVGACGDVVPLIAMAVDPIVARLDTGIFKASPVFRLKGLRTSTLDYVDPLEQWLEYYQKHRLQLRQVAQPRLLELTKHGTMVFKTVFDCVKYKTKGYDSKWNVVDREVTQFEGPRVFGISLSDIMFPPHYQHLQDCPIVIERQRVTWEQLKIAEKSNKLTGVDRIKGQEIAGAINTLEQERAVSVNYEDPRTHKVYLEIFECWFDFMLDEDQPPVRLCATYHLTTQTLLQLRYNWYFHQRKPYTLIPYTVTNDSLWGIGISEMTLPFQDMLTSWHRHALNNAYLANIRMYVARRNSGIEAKPRLYTGKVFFVDDPAKDFIPFNAAQDIYPSTLTERQNIIGLAEKRTGVSDYLTGRESPIVGSRATATSTIALINEGTKRVEEVLENIRAGFAEIMEFCMYIWIQFGLGDIAGLVFSGDDILAKLQDFFDQVDQDNVNGALAIDLSATDAASNRSVQQQTQLAVIQVMMTYLQKVVELGQMAAQSAQTMPMMVTLAAEVATAARLMFKDLLTKYEIRNPEEYLPDLEGFLQQLGGGGAPPTQNGARDASSQFDVSTLGGISPVAGQPSNGAGPAPEQPAGY